MLMVLSTFIKTNYNLLLLQKPDGNDFGGRWISYMLDFRFAASSNVTNRTSCTFKATIVIGQGNLLARFKFKREMIRKTNCYLETDN